MTGHPILGPEQTHGEIHEADTPHHHHEPRPEGLPGGVPEDLEAAEAAHVQGESPALRPALPHQEYGEEHESAQRGRNVHFEG